MLISKYGFFDVAGPGVSIDPSRMAAEVVSGLGFIGGGLLFVRRDAVRGLTTAAVVWLTAAVGMAAGAGLPLLAVLVTAGHFVIVYGFTPLSRRLSRRLTGVHQVHLTYREGGGVLRRALAERTSRGFAVRHLATAPDEDDRWDDGGRGGRRVSRQPTVEGRGPPRTSPRGSATSAACWPSPPGTSTRRRTDRRRCVAGHATGGNHPRSDAANLCGSASAGHPPGRNCPGTSASVQIRRHR